MTVTQVRDSESQGRDIAERYLLDVELFDKLMNTKGVTTASARARLAGVSRSTYYRVLNHEVDVQLGVAMGFAAAAEISVNQLFSQAQGSPTPPPRPGPTSPTPPPRPRGSAS